MKKEMRKIDILSEIRAEEGDGGRKLSGLIPYNTRSVEMWGGFEIITSSAFKKTLADGADVRALVAHDDRLVLGSTKAGTMRLTNDEIGLHIEVDLPDTSYARDAWEVIKRGDVRTMSFAFMPIKTREGWDEEAQKKLNYLDEVRLLEVSFVVTFPAYPETQSVARAVDGLEIDKFIDALVADKPTDEQAQTLRVAQEIIAKRLEPPAEPVTAAAENTAAERDIWQALMEAAQKL